MFNISSVLNLSLKTQVHAAVGSCAECPSMWPFPDSTGLNVLRCIFHSYGTVQKLLYIVTLWNSELWNATLCGLVNVHQYSTSVFQEENISTFIYVYEYISVRVLFVYTYIYIYINIAHSYVMTAYHYVIKRPRIALTSAICQTMTYLHTLSRKGSFPKMLLNIKSVFWFSLQPSTEHLLSDGLSETLSKTNIRLHVK